MQGDGDVSGDLVVADCLHIAELRAGVVQYG